MPANITWLLNGKKVNYYDGIVINMVNKKLSTLSIDNVNAVHAGEYTCKAQNLAGEAEHKAFLRVNGTTFSCIVFACL